MDQLGLGNLLRSDYFDVSIGCDGRQWDDTSPRSINPHYNIGMQLLLFGFTLWLGAYLIARNSQKIAVHLTGWGLLAYAVALAFQIIFDQFILIILLLPALLWIGAALHLLPEENPARSILIRIWLIAFIPLAILTQLNAWFAGLIILALAVCAGMVAKLALRTQYKNTFALLAVITLFVTLSAGLLILPLHWIPLSWAMALLGPDPPRPHIDRMGCLRRRRIHPRTFGALVYFLFILFGRVGDYHKSLQQ
jgi:hypothetical protein